MNSPQHGPRHEEQLLEILRACPDLASGVAAAERSALGRCPACRDELETLVELERALDAAGQDERATIAASRELETAPGEGHVATVGRAAAAGRAAGPDGSRGLAARTPASLRWIAVAAAALVAVFALRWDPGAPPRPDPEWMGAGGLEIVRPAGLVDAWSPFEWTLDAAEAAWFEVYVYDAEALGGASPLVESGRLNVPRWEPTAEDSAWWPRRIRWTVSGFGPSGAFVGSAEAWATRRD